MVRAHDSPNVESLWVEDVLREDAHAASINEASAVTSPVLASCAASLITVLSVNCIMWLCWE